MKNLNLVVSVSMFALVAGSHAAMFQADSAVAGSTYSSAYTIDNTINGSGLPTGFLPTDAHDPYSNGSGGNHWTTAANAINNGTAWAEYSFDADVTVGTLYMWNHQSNGGLASNPDYDVTLFNLILKDGGGNTLYSLLNQSALEDITTAQVFAFAPVSGVRTVRFEILANARPNNDSYTGLAEVAFDTEAVPEPATLSMAALAGAALLRKRFRKTA